MSSGSLRLRLVAGGAAAIIAALVVAGFGLSMLFERHVLRTLTDELEFDLRQALGSIALDASGKPSLARNPRDHRFSEPLSGRYWQVSARGGNIRSRSLWDAVLPVPEDVLTPGEQHRHRLPGPGGSELIAIERTVILSSPEGPAPVRVVVAGDLAHVAAARRAFSRDLVPALGLLAVVLGIATWVQIGLGLKPMTGVKNAVAAIREGRAVRIGSTVPSEVAPLVEELNTLLAAQERELERSRGRAADLAHGLKTPLAALEADVRSLEERGDHELASRIREVGDSMYRHVERELARARIRGLGRGGGAAETAVAPLVVTLLSIQRRTDSSRRITFSDAVGEDARIAMDKVDLAEVLGNLIENAARNARSRVHVGMSSDGRITIADDGPGIPEAVRKSATERGWRLDQSSGGAGLGLAIVEDVLDAYGRKLALGASEWGGLEASF